jgi:hypothetical protein
MSWEWPLRNLSLPFAVGSRFPLCWLLVLIALDSLLFLLTLDVAVVDQFTGKVPRHAEVAVHGTVLPATAIPNT